ncbi:CU044_2847 family protein [Streptomyces sp. CA-111067]|uniref:CU044_2847 family protein n=1 Tax=Streptomyces sp. CA-111067 TaxID=3240046 RepID=UPI003D967964
MPDAVTFTLSDGTVVLVTPTTREGTGVVGLGGRLEAARQSLLDALVPVTSAASDVIDGFRTLTHRPDEIEVSFGVVLDGKLGGVLASTSAGAHLDVTLRWSGSPATPPPDGPVSS